MNRVVVIGGGFCGTVTAVNLARLTESPLTVTLVNGRHPTGRGVAYGTLRPEHVTNVVARNMSALADQPEHFVEWIGTRSDFAHVPLAELREAFVPRRVFGDYLQSLLLWYASAFADGRTVRIDRLTAEATDVEPAGPGVRVKLADGRTLDADRVVLATGNPPPADLPGLALDHPRYVRDPWGDWPERLPDHAEPVILFGTGLTMVDAYLTLGAVGWKGKVVAISRSGLLPMSHFKGPDYPGFPEGDPTALGLDGMVKLLETHCRELRAKGLNPAILVDKLRPHTQRVYQQFTLDEKKRFLKDYRARWGAARHRVPEFVAAEIDRGVKSGQLDVLAGQIAALMPKGGGLVVVVDAAGGRRELPAGLVINCTGPNENPDTSGQLLYRRLLDRGLVSVDDVGLGVRATADFVATDKAGERSRWLRVLGPPLRGSLWETTAVPELRAQAFRVAEGIVAELRAGRAAVKTVEETYADVVEYSI